MADSNLSGPIYGNRQGSDLTVHTFQFTPTTNASGIALPNFPIIQASTGKPVIAEMQIFVNTLDAGASAAVSLGTSTTATEFISGALLAAASVFLPASNATAKLYLVADTTIFYKTTGTIAGTGVVTVIVSLSTVNLSVVAS